MQSSIFQITTEPIAKKCYLNENTLEQGESTYWKYCMNIDPDCRKENITCLVNEILPKGMFELISEDSFRYKGNIDIWKKEYIDNIYKKSEEINFENMMNWSPRYNLKQAIDNPLNTDFYFYFDQKGKRGTADQSFTFMHFISNLEPGTILYVGGVIDYYY